MKKDTYKFPCHQCRKASSLYSRAEWLTREMEKLAAELGFGEQGHSDGQCNQSVNGLQGSLPGRDEPVQIFVKAKMNVSVQQLASMLQDCANSLELGYPSEVFRQASDDQDLPF